MGYWGEKSLENDERHSWARDFLVEVGALEECKNHPGTYFEGGEDITEAYKLLNAKVSAGKITLAKGESRKDLTDLLKSVYDDNSGLDGCQECGQNFGPD